MSVLRYPGGKTKMAGKLARVLTPCVELREPFFGSGVGTLAAGSGYRPPSKLWINDADAGIAAIWTSIIRDPDGLVDRLEKWRPSVEAFHDYKASLLADAPMTELERGFRKLAVHLVSFSGLGTRAGSPMGGKKASPVVERGPVEVDVMDWLGAETPPASAISSRMDGGPDPPRSVERIVYSVTGATKTVARATTPAT